MDELSEYELLRLERIRRNEARLESLGLLKAQRDVMSHSPKKKKRPQVKVVVTPPGEERRSKRIKKNRSNGGKDEDGLIMLSYYDGDDNDRRATAVKQTDYRQVVEVVDTTGDDFHTPNRRSLLRVSTSKVVLTKEEKQVLAKNQMDQNYLDKFREFLVYHNKISEQNERNVMRQVTKLALGQGVRYESEKYGWPEGCYFHKGIKVTPLSDLVELFDKAVEAENKWGQDRGNGWLLRHPIKKLLLFQQFCLNNPDFLTAKCKLKDYYASAGR